MHLCIKRGFSTNHRNSMVMVEKVCQLQQRQRKTKKGKQRENVERRAALSEVMALDTFNILFSASLETLTFNTSRLTAVETIHYICMCARKLQNIVDMDCKLLVTMMEVALGLALFRQT